MHPEDQDIESRLSALTAAGLEPGHEAAILRAIQQSASAAVALPGAQPGRRRVLFAAALIAACIGGFAAGRLSAPSPPTNTLPLEFRVERPVFARSTPRIDIEFTNWKTLVAEVQGEPQ